MLVVLTTRLMNVWIVSCCRASSCPVSVHSTLLPDGASLKQLPSCAMSFLRAWSI